MCTCLHGDKSAAPERHEVGLPALKICTCNAEEFQKAFDEELAQKQKALIDKKADVAAAKRNKTPNVGVHSLLPLAQLAFLPLLKTLLVCNVLPVCSLVSRVLACISFTFFHMHAGDK